MTNIQKYVIIISKEIGLCHLCESLFLFYLHNIQSCFSSPHLISPSMDGLSSQLVSKYYHNSLLGPYLAPSHRSVPRNMNETTELRGSTDPYDITEWQVEKFGISYNSQSRCIRKRLGRYLATNSRHRVICNQKGVTFPCSVSARSAD